MKSTKVDQSTCIGCGLCVSIYKDAYSLEITQEGEEKARAHTPAEADMEKLNDTIASCPTSSIQYDE